LKSIEKATLLWKTNKDKAQNKSHLNLRHEGEGIEIKMDDISHFQSIGNYIKIFFKVQCKPMTVYDSLKNILSNTASEKFIQTHKSYVLNVDCIKNIEKDRVVLINGINVPLGRKYELLVNKTKNSQ
jgi:DNA-binding LytR/AlgR family response regulator